MLYEALKFLPVQAWTSSLVLCGGWSYLSPDFGHSVIALRAVTDFSSAHDYAQIQKNCEISWNISDTRKLLRALDCNFLLLRMRDEVGKHRRENTTARSTKTAIFKLLSSALFRNIISNMLYIFPLWLAPKKTQKRLPNGCWVALIFCKLILFTCFEKAYHVTHFIEIYG